MSGIEAYQLVDSLKQLFHTPSRMNGEDPDLYANLYAAVEDAVKPKDVWDQMMVSDITNHFWEQQRLRRHSGTIVNAARRQALVNLLVPIFGYNRPYAAWLADIYFGLTVDEDKASTAHVPESWATSMGPRRPPITRRMTPKDIVAALEKHGLDESAIDGVALQRSLAALTDIENLTLKHELRREAIFREVERRRKKRAKQQRAAGPARLNGKTPALSHPDDLPEESSPPLSEVPS